MSAVLKVHKHSTAHLCGGRCWAAHRCRAIKRFDDAPSTSYLLSLTHTHPCGLHQLAGMSRSMAHTALLMVVVALLTARTTADAFCQNRERWLGSCRCVSILAFETDSAAETCRQPALLDSWCRACRHSTTTHISPRILLLTHTPPHLPHNTHAVLPVADGSQIGADILVKGSYWWNQGLNQKVLFNGKMTSGTKGNITGTVPVTFPTGVCVSLRGRCVASHHRRHTSGARGRRPACMPHACNAHLPACLPLIQPACLPNWAVQNSMRLILPTPFTRPPPPPPPIS